MTEDEFSKAVTQNSQRVFLIALSFLKNRSDAEDVMQNVFLKLWQNNKPFENAQHIAKWLTTVSVNESKNLLKSHQRKTAAQLTEISEAQTFECTKDKELFDAVMSLPPRSSSVLHLFYYEELSVKEIAEALHIRENAVKTRLSRARKQLKETLGDEWIDE